MDGVLKDHHVIQKVNCCCHSHHTGEHSGREYGQTQALHFDAKGRMKDGISLEDGGSISF